MVFRKPALNSEIDMNIINKLISRINRLPCSREILGEVVFATRQAKNLRDLISKFGMFRINF